MQDEEDCDADECCTPEMMEAGMDAYNKWYATPEGDIGPLSSMVKAIFIAMQKRHTVVLNMPPIILEKFRPPPEG